AWFHLRERGVFGGVFGILISLGLYFAFDWCALIARYTSAEWVFWIPAGLLALFCLIVWIFVRDTPVEAGFREIETGDNEQTAINQLHNSFIDFLRSIFTVGRGLLKNYIILTIAMVEFCSGYIRSALIDWYAIFKVQTGINNFIAMNWGLVQCCAGIAGGMLAGIVSDYFFQSRRGPVASILYGVVFIGSATMWLFIEHDFMISITVTLMMLSIIGVHGMLSGAASMDFGGKQNVGIVVGIIDGLVYLGQGVQYLILGHIVPSDKLAGSAANWIAWPLAMMPVAFMGWVLSTSIWKAFPTTQAKR
ncbi:MAG: MFS transporter, partial [Sandaracinaceae bacterium]|nr:MFS transporter [Sandaracinaceae bacterium]